MILGKNYFLNYNPFSFGLSTNGGYPQGGERSDKKRPELRGRNINSSNHSKNSLRSNSFSYFVIQIAFRNPKLNVDSKNLHSSKDLFVRNVFSPEHSPPFPFWGLAPIMKETWRTPKGQRLESHTKTLMERVFPRNQLHPLQIGRGLGKVDASFSSFLRAEEKDKSGAWGLTPAGEPCFYSKVRMTFLYPNWVNKLRSWDSALDCAAFTFSLVRQCWSIWDWALR